MELRDSRRLTGRSLLLDGPGAVIDAAVAPADADRLVDAWRRHARAALGAVGWGAQPVAAAVHPGGASLAIGAPADCLYAATEVNEWAWEAAAAELRGDTPLSIEADAPRLRELIAEEHDPRLMALRDFAARAGVTFLADDRSISVGTGTGCQSWDADAAPDPASVDWSRVHDVPAALVTGTNGKTTTVRLLAAMVAADGRAAGFASTDEVVVAGETVERGDFSGPMGARRVLRDARVEVAVLETARGGILRRGLVIGLADVAVVTNVSEDHLGEFGVHDLAGLARAKLLVAAAVRPGGRVVLNAEDAALAEAGGAVGKPVTWFALDPSAPRVRQAVASGGRAAFTERGWFALARGAERIPLCKVADAPLAMDGAARHNVANALAAIAAADALGVSVDAIADGLRTFGRDPGANEGRGAVREVGGVRVLVDFAHNPSAVAALADVAAHLPAERRLLLLGQAGDRDDDAIRALVRKAVAMRPQHVIIKEMLGLLRGRRPAETPALIRDELLAAGIPGDAIDHYAPSEYEGVRRALAWARPGDLLVLPIHKERPRVEALLAQLSASDWHPGDPIPD
jgi:UDP-N-acetylmuramyl tripeptide synthase